MLAQSRTLSLSVVAGLLWLAPVEARPLEPEACAKLTADVKALDALGINDILAKGPAATKANLTKEQREQIRSYLDMLGSLRFRCPSDAPFVTLRPEAPEDPAEAGAAFAPIEANAPGITLPPGVAAAVVAPIVPQKPAVPKVVKSKAAPAKAGEPAAAPSAPAAPAPTTAAPAAKKAAPKAAAPPQATAPQAAPPAPAAAVPAQPAPAQGAAPAAPKPKPKPKADDAFKPGEGKQPAPQ